MNLLEQLARSSVLVIGDIMLDEYIQGLVRRVSPEAPVPVVETQSVSCFPGGAGNVAANIASLGARAYVVGGIGNDSQAEHLRKMLEQQQVKTSGLVSFGSRPTTTKTRVIAHSQQMLRIDREYVLPLDTEEEDLVLSAVERLMSGAGACILSDYAKGILTPRVCQRTLEQAQAHKIPVVVDPKGRRFDKYAGATVITPNLDEARQAIAALDGTVDVELRTDQEIETLTRKLIAQYHSAVLVTRGAQGMSLIQLDRPAVHIPAHARQVYDVTGAGDTVVALLALGLASGLPLEAAARLGNWAAGIVVSKLGTATVTPEELQQTDCARFA